MKSDRNADIKAYIPVTILASSSISPIPSIKMA